MQISGLRYGKELLQHVDFPVAECLEGNVTKEELQIMLDRYGKIVVKPFFYGGVGKKGKAGLIRIVDNVVDAMAAKQELYFATTCYGNKQLRANGVTFEEYVTSDIEIFFSIAASTRYRKPIFTITPHGGVSVESLPPEKKKA